MPEDSEDSKLGLGRENRTYMDVSLKSELNSLRPPASPHLWMMVVPAVLECVDTGSRDVAEHVTAAPGRTILL